MLKNTGKHLPGTVPSPKCLENPQGKHIPDPEAPEWCLNCEEWLGSKEEDSEECYRCGGDHSPDECSSPYICQICSMDGPMDGDRFDYSELDPGIRNSVKFLRDHGFWTTDSGDGISKSIGGKHDPDEFLFFPHVNIVVEPRNMVEEARKLMAVLSGHGIRVQQFGFRNLNPKWYQSLDNDEKPTWDINKAVEIEASYDPVTDMAVIMVAYISDDLLREHGIGLEAGYASN